MINIIKDLFSGDHKDFSKLKKSISYAFDQKYMKNSVFQRTIDDDKDEKLKFQHQIMKQQYDKKSLFFKNSPHVN